MRVAALADVHGNAPALEAVLHDLESVNPDLVVFGGDLTWGSFPGETLALIRAMRWPARFVRGNGDRAVGVDLGKRGAWIAAAHSAEDIAFVKSFETRVSVDVDELGAVCFCHGSPRSDEECVTERTPPERVREFMAGVNERVAVTGHVHLQLDRVVGAVRLLSPGSVGLPYEGPPCAYWAILGPDVELRRTDYDVNAAVKRMRATDDPSSDVITELMLNPPGREEVIADAEERVFAG